MACAAATTSPSLSDASRRMRFANLPLMGARSVTVYVSFPHSKGDSVVHVVFDDRVHRRRQLSRIDALWSAVVATLARRDCFQRNGFFFHWLARGGILGVPVPVVPERELDEVSTPIVTIDAISLAQHPAIGDVD